MDMNRYQKLAKKTALYPGSGKNIYYPTLGLVGEAGEIANKVKKIMRDNNGEINLITRALIAYELGDVLWYLSDIARVLKVPLNTIAKRNLEKLESRRKRGQIKGNGDNR